MKKAAKRENQRQKTVRKDAPSRRAKSEEQQSPRTVEVADIKGSPGTKLVQRTYQGATAAPPMKKVAGKFLSSLDSIRQPPASEGRIEEARSKTKRVAETFAAATLPDVPPALWPGRPRGRPRPGATDPLLAF